MRNETKQKKNIEAVKPELEKYKEIINFFLKDHHHKECRKQKVEQGKAEAKENNAAAGAICEIAEAETEEVERMCKGNIMSDSVVTANETGGWHDPNENENSAEVTGEEHLDRGTVNDDADNVETANGRRRFHSVPQRSCRAQYGRRHGRKRKKSSTIKKKWKTVRKKARQQQQKRLIANVFDEFYKNFTTTMSKTNMEMKATLTCTLATLKK